MATVLGARIRQARLRAGLTQAELARATKTSERNIVRWETSANAPRMESVAAIARATGHSLDDFLGDEDDEEAAPLGRSLSSDLHRLAEVAALLERNPDLLKELA